MIDTLNAATAAAPTWAGVALEIWRDVRGEVLTGVLAFLAGWLGLKRPRFNRRTRAGDSPKQKV